MSSKNYFEVYTSLIDRQDLNIYEKMCCIVLARYAGREEFNGLITVDVIAGKMGTTRKNAVAALKSLIRKGLIDSEDSGIKDAYFMEIASEAAKKNAEISDEKTPEVRMESKPDMVVQRAIEAKEMARGDEREREEKRPSTKPSDGSSKNIDQLINEVYSIIDETINEREARIILNFAGNDTELVREKYEIAKKSQISDKVELLLNELQKKPKKKESPGHAEDDLDASNETNASLQTPSTASDINVDSVSYRPGGQINMSNISKMKKYRDALDMVKKK